MKKSFKTLVLGIVIGALSVSVPALAEAVFERIDVMRNQIDVMIDGEKLEADNFVYKNTTYVPIRAVAEGLGRNVTYKDGVAYIEEKYAASFDGEKIQVGSYDATTGEFNAYKHLCTVQVGSSMSEDEIITAANDALLEYKALESLAADNGIVIGEEFYNNFSATIAYMKTQYGGEEALNKALEDAGYSYEMFKRYHETQYLYNKLADGAFAATDDEIKAYYDSHADDYAYDGVQAKHILISTKDENGADITDSKTLKTLETKANSVYKEATGGADFDELIGKYNEDPGMTQNPDGYVFTKGEMVEEFEEAAFALSDGEISKPVKSPYGYHIIKKIKTVSTYPLEKLTNSISSIVTQLKLENAVTAKKVQ